MKAQTLAIDNLSIYGQMTVDVIRDGPNGPVVKDRRVIRNVVTSIGKKNILRAVAGLNSLNADQARIGTCGAAATSNQTNVISPITSTLTTVDSKTMDGRTLQLVVSYPSCASSKSVTGIKEVAILSERTSPGGSCYARAVLSPSVNKTTNDKLKITYEVRIT